MKRETKKSLRSLLVITMALVMLFGIIPLGVVAVFGDDIGSVEQSESQNEELGSYAEGGIFPVPASDYDITYVLGLAGATHSNPSTFSAADLPISLSDPTGPPGYVFRGWVPSNTIPVGTIGDRTFTASWFRLIDAQSAVFIEGNYRIEISAAGTGSSIRFGMRTLYEGLELFNHQDIQPNGSGQFWQRLDCCLGFSFLIHIQGNDLSGAVGHLIGGGAYDVVYLDYDERLISVDFLRRQNTVQTVRVAPPVPATRLGYEFAGWLRECNGEIYQPGSTFVMPENIVFFRAQWRRDPTQTMTITYVVGLGQGSVTPPNETIHVLDTPTGSTATAATGYRFVNWTNAADAEVSASANWVPAAGGVSRTYTANFERDPTQTKTITYVVGLGQGSVTPPNETIHVLNPPTGSTATAATGYRFVNWTNAAGAEVSANANWVPAAGGAFRTYTANFERDPTQTYTITYIANLGGSVNPASETNQILTAPSGSTATALPGFTFVNWTDSEGEIVSVNANFVPEARENATFYANFRPNEDIELTVNFFLQGTTTPVAASVTRTGLTMGASHPETAPTIAGHALVGADTQTITLAATGNVITFYYTVYYYYAPPGADPEGSIEKRADRRVTLIEHPINYIITVTNTSDEVMSGFTVIDEIDTDHVRFAEGTLRVNDEVHANATYADGVIRVELDDLEPGDVVVIRFGVIVLREAVGQVVYNTATLSHPTYGDVSASANVEVEVLSIVPNLTHFSYLIGYEDGTVRPRSNISRAEVATIFFRLICDEYRADIWSQENDFSDVLMRNWHNNAVSTMANEGFLLGYRDGTFRPNNAITRAEFATIVSRFMNVRYTGENKFSDIDGHWAATAINSVAYVGWVTGYGDGTFRPNNTITRAEAAAIVNRIFLRHPESVEDLLSDMTTWPDNANRNMWYYLHIQEATNSHNHEMKDCGIFETWTELIPARDWRVLQLPTSTPQCIMD